MKRTKNTAQTLVDFIYEVGILQRTPRSGLWFLGTGEQSVSEHLLRTAYIGCVLSFLTPKANRDTVIRMCLFHDLGEGRTSDLNYVHQKYGRLAEDKAIADIAQAIPFGAEIQALYNEVHEKKSLEARLTKDADNIEWIATLCEQSSQGNTKAKTWIAHALQRLATPAGKKIGRHLAKTHPDHWWFDKNDTWFINRKPQTPRSPAHKPGL